ncbi:hypothetical protein [Nonomuraea zeae]|nr:hypothetical protein [Nonomuraea zeae]
MTLSEIHVNGWDVTQPSAAIVEPFMAFTIADRSDTGPSPS